MGYHEFTKAVRTNPEAYWLEQSKASTWEDAPRQALFDKGKDLYEWFRDARVNRVTTAVDRHVENGRGRCRWRLFTTAAITGHPDQDYFCRPANSASQPVAGVLTSDGVARRPA